MYLKHLSLQNFRNYSKVEFNFSKDTTLIVGPNTSGKSNLVEAIYLLSLGKSFRAEKDFQMIKFGEEIARVKGEVLLSAGPAARSSKGAPSSLILPSQGSDEGALLRTPPLASPAENINIEVVLTKGQVGGQEAPLKKYLVNGVSKRRADFAGNLVVVLFNPEDLDIIVDSPSLRRRFLDEVLEQADRDYRLALASYAKGLRQRNALLEMARESGRRNDKQFEYWDNLLVENGTIITKKRQEFIDFVNNNQKDLFEFTVFYDHSIISPERLFQYKEAELGAGVTLVGPHRDDISIRMHANDNSANEYELVDVKYYGSRGQQRLVILQLKLLQLAFIEQRLGIRPLLILDDIFSELDEKHINLVLQMLGKQQSIITTTHMEFLGGRVLESSDIIKLER